MSSLRGNRWIWVLTAAVVLGIFVLFLTPAKNRLEVNEAEPSGDPVELGSLPNKPGNLDAASAEQSLESLRSLSIEREQETKHRLASAALTPVDPPNKKLARGMNANIDSVIEAAEGTGLAERLSPMIAPAPFDVEQFRRSPEAYLDVVEPGRAWQSAPPGPGIKSIGTNKNFHEVEAGESVRLQALAVPNGPIAFTSTDLGAFQNDLSSITVLADDRGWAEATFTATPGTVGGVNVSAASPMASGRLSFFINILP